MIYDRTREDVVKSISIRTEKVKSFRELTQDEKSTLERGTVTISTLNRIEQKQAELKGLLNSLGYWNTDFNNATWGETDIFSESDFGRILNIIDVLKKAFFVYLSTPKTPNMSYHYETFNDMEKILYDLGVMVDDVKSNFRECGTFVCGE